LIDPADPQQLFELLRRHRITLKHRFGQNFLVHTALRDAIAQATEATRQDTVVEVGAGVGTLTIALAERAGHVIAVELDRDLIPALREVVHDLDNVEIVQGDILRMETTGDVVAGNIPYNLTGALIEKLLDKPPRPRRLSLVVQREVANRWTASRAASLATVAVQVFAEARTVFTIPAGAFEPPPKVDSALVVLDVRPRPAVTVDDYDRFFRFVEAVFQFRRKQLGGTLRRLGLRELPELGIDLTRRPETLDLGEWETLYRAVNP
jgi:16S rRNA (adenine1518-N6/adenine1519-N6)-dimethyltransferase